MYGRLTDKQTEVVRSYVLGQDVLDLGAGDLSMTLQILNLGAAKITAVDRNQFPPQKDSRLTLIQSRFDAFFESVTPIVVLSWPVNWIANGLVRLVSQAKIVLYLGKNTDGCACGGVDLWSHLRGREILSYVPDCANVLIVYGDQQVVRSPVGEERAVSQTNRVMSFQESESE